MLLSQQLLPVASPIHSKPSAWHSRPHHPTRSPAEPRHTCSSSAIALRVFPACGALLSWTALFHPSGLRAPFQPYRGRCYLSCPFEGPSRTGTTSYTNDGQIWAPILTWCILAGWPWADPFDFLSLFLHLSCLWEQMRSRAHRVLLRVGMKFMKSPAPLDRSECWAVRASIYL